MCHCSLLDRNYFESRISSSSKRNYCQYVKFILWQNTFCFPYVTKELKLELKTDGAKDYILTHGSKYFKIGKRIIPVSPS